MTATKFLVQEEGVFTCVFPLSVQGLAGRHRENHHPRDEQDLTGRTDWTGKYNQVGRIDPESPGERVRGVTKPSPLLRCLVDKSGGVTLSTQLTVK